jgi:hypothetical protein
MIDNSLEKSGFSGDEDRVNRELERVDMPENKPDLSSSAVGFRVFNIGDFDEQKLKFFNSRVQSIRDLAGTLKGKLGDKSPKVTIITNDNLSEVGREILSNSGLAIVWAMHVTAERRARLAKHLVGETSQATGNFSYADMLNSLSDGLEELQDEKKSLFFVSSDLAGKGEILCDQIVNMRIVYDWWQRTQANGLAMIGSLIKGVHDDGLVTGVIDGDDNVDLDNLHKLFPNNSLSLVPKTARFSGITDNALAGNIEIDGRFEPIGGNEDFLYGFEEMLLRGQDCILLVEPFIGERQGEVKGVESKYVRRKIIYSIYAKRVIEQAVERGQIVLDGQEGELSQTKIEAIVEDVIDNHLFFVRLSNASEPEIILTERQKLKSIIPPTPENSN